MIARVFQLGLRCVLVLLIVAHLALLAGVAIEKSALAQARAHYASSALPYAQPTGYTLGGLPLEFAPKHSGFAIRFASNNCPYSKGDEHWKAIVPMLGTHRIPVTVLLPNAAHAFPPFAVVPLGAPQAAYVDVDWIKEYRLTLTPTVLVFDADRHVVWHREGVLRRDDATSLLRVLKTARMHK